MYQKHAYKKNEEKKDLMSIWDYPEAESKNTMQNQLKTHKLALHVPTAKQRPRGKAD